MEQKQTDEERRIAKRMVAEDEYIRKHEVVARKERKYKEKYQSEMGRGATEARVKNYMISKTVSYEPVWG